MTLGAVEAARSLGHGVEIALAMELDPEIRKIYDKNFPSVVGSDRADVAERFDGRIGKRLTLTERRTAKDVGPVDLLLGGPPCQGHSNLNNHTRRSDPKNALYLRMLRAIEVLRPKSVVIENVPEVLHSTYRVVPRVVNFLDSLDYAVVQTVIGAGALGVAQLRSRHVLLATKKPVAITNDNLELRKRTTPRTVGWAIRDLVYEHDGSDDIFRTPSSLSDDNLERARYLHRHKKSDLPNSERPDCHKDKPKHKYKSMYGRLSWGLPAQTITTGFGSPGQGRYFHPTELRTLTPHEAARIQFFPDWFDFSTAKHRRVLAESIGNAVPPKMSFTLSRAVLSALLSSVVEPAEAEEKIRDVA